jgi:predicted dehydrogenase
MLGWMLGRPSRVSSVLTNVSHDNAEVEDLSVAVFEYNGGALGQVTSSVVHHGEEQHVIFQGEKAMIAAPWKAYASVTKPNGFPIENKDLEKELQEDYEKIPELKYTIHTGQIENVLTAIETGAEPLIKGTDGRLTIELITAIYKAGTEKRSVNLPISPDDPFYSAAGIMKNVPHFYKKSASVENFGDNESITVGSDYKK